MMTMWMGKVPGKDKPESSSDGLGNKHKEGEKELATIANWDRSEGEWGDRWMMVDWVVGPEVKSGGPELPGILCKAKRGLLRGLMFLNLSDDSDGLKPLKRNMVAYSRGVKKGEEEGREENQICTHF